MGCLKMKESFLLFFLVDTVFSFSPVSSDPKINEVYLKPSYSEEENEEYIEILLPIPNPSPTYMHGYGMIIIDHNFLIDYIDFSMMEIVRGKDDIVNDNTLVVVSNNESTSNVLFLCPEMNLRATSVHALILLKKPVNQIDVTKLELKRITKMSRTYLYLTRRAPLTNANKEVLRRLLVDIIVYRKSHHNDDVNIWIQSIKPTWRGISKLLPIGADDLLDKVSLARCDRAHLSGNSFKHDKPTPGFLNLCATIVDEETFTVTQEGYELLQNRRTIVPETDATEPVDLTAMEASPENQVSNYLPQLRSLKLLGETAAEFFENGKNRKFYSFLPNTDDIRQSAIRCELCFRSHQNPQQHLHLERHKGQIPSIMKVEGQKLRTHSRDTWKKIREHESYAYHIEAIRVMKETNRVQEEDVYSEIGPNDELTVTADKISLVYLEVKIGLSMRAHEVLSQGLVHLGFNLGHSLNGRNAAHDIIHFLGTKIHSNMIQRLIKSDVEFSIMLDASTDIGLVHTLLVYIRYTEDGMPVIKVLALIESHDSTANGMWDVVEKAIQKEGPEFVAYFKRRCVALGSDGASAMIGEFNSFKTKISAYVMTGERAGRPLQHYHCANHKLALAYNDVMFSTTLDFCKTLTNHCNDLARFYSSKSYKRRDEMLMTSRELEESIRSFQRIQKVRWVPATQTSYEVVIQNYKTFMTHLEKVTRDQTSPYPPEARATAAKLFNTFSDKDFISTLHLHLDVIQELSKWAKALEKKESTVIDIERWFTQVQNTLESLKQNPGPNLEQFLKTCKCGLSPCGTLNMYEQTAEVTWKDKTLSGNGVSKIPKLSTTRVLLLSSLINSFHIRFPPNAVSAFSVLQPSFLHMRSDIQWHNLGIYLNQYYGYPNLISTQLISLKDRIVASEFHRKYSEDPPEIYWPNALANRDFQWTTDLRRIIRIALVQPSSTAQVESGFSLVVAIKTQYRSRLATPIVQDTLRLKFNGPSVEYLPKYRLARDWINEGHIKADSAKKHKSEKILRRSEYSQTMRF